MSYGTHGSIASIEMAWSLEDRDLEGGNALGSRRDGWSHMVKIMVLCFGRFGAQVEFWGNWYA